jgi:hypothetical protein
MLGNVTWNLEGDSVQDCWNEFENKLISINDYIVPLTEFSDNTIIKLKTAPEITNFKNIWKRLLKKSKQNKNPDLKIKIKILDVKIRSFFNTAKCKRVWGIRGLFGK